MCICCSWTRSWYCLKENSYFGGRGKHLRIVQGQVKEHTACLLAPGGSLKIKGLKSFIHGVTNWLLWSIHYSALLPLLSCFSHVQLCVTLWTTACQTRLSMGFSRQGYQSGLPCPPPGYLPDPGIELTSHVISCIAGRFFTAEPPGKPYIYSKELLQSKGMKALSKFLKMRILKDRQGNFEKIKDGLDIKICFVLIFFSNGSILQIMLSTIFHPSLDLEANTHQRKD